MNDKKDEGFTVTIKGLKSSGFTLDELIFEGNDKSFQSVLFFLMSIGDDELTEDQINAIVSGVEGVDQIKDIKEFEDYLSNYDSDDSDDSEVALPKVGGKARRRVLGSGTVLQSGPSDDTQENNKNE